MTAVLNRYYPGPEAKAFPTEMVWNAGSTNPSEAGKYFAAIYVKGELTVGSIKWDGERWRNPGGYGVDTPDFWCDPSVPKESLGWRKVRNG